MWRVALTGATYPRDGSGSVGGVRGWQIDQGLVFAVAYGGYVRMFDARKFEKVVVIKCVV